MRRWDLDLVFEFNNDIDLCQSTPDHLTVTAVPLTVSNFNCRYCCDLGDVPLHIIFSINGTPSPVISAINNYVANLKHPFLTSYWNLEQPCSLLQATDSMILAKPELHNFSKQTSSPRRAARCPKCFEQRVPCAISEA